MVDNEGSPSQPIGSADLGHNRAKNRRIIFNRNGSTWWSFNVISTILKNFCSVLKTIWLNTKHTINNRDYKNDIDLNQSQLKIHNNHKSTEKNTQ